MPSTQKIRYDGIADWYDAASSPHYAQTLVSQLGIGHSLCLNLGCGTGHYFEAIRSTGRELVALDVSADQLRVTRTRGDRLV